MGPHEVNGLHSDSDLDSSDWAQHHTLGYDPGQAAPGSSVGRRLSIVEADTGWISPTFNTGMTNYGSGYAPAGYRIKNGVIFYRGLIVSANASTPGTLWLSGFPAIPFNRIQMFNNRDIGNFVYRFDLTTTGTLIYQTDNPNWTAGQWINLENITPGSVT